MGDQFGQKDFGGKYGRNYGFGGNNFGNSGNFDMMRQMEDRMREMEYAFKQMDQCMEKMNSDYQSVWKDNIFFKSGNYNDWERCSNEMEFHQTLKNGEFFRAWHYQDQRLWKIEQFCSEMAKRMDFMDMDMQMQSSMKSHDMMFSNRSSWMTSNRKAIGNG